MVELAIGSRPTRQIKLSRRRMIQLAMSMSALGACAPAVETAQDGIAPWPNDLPVPDVKHAGYGTFPDYFEIGDTGPWPKVLSDQHKQKLEKFADLILPATENAPAPSEVGIADFFDDWTSAPYPWMTDTRKTVHRGFIWLDRQAQLMFKKDWLDLSKGQASEIFKLMRTASHDEGPLTQPAWMYKNLRELTIGAYYTTPEGEADLGHVSAQPITGDYPGPTGEALDHIQELIISLDLAWDDLPVGPPPYDTVKPYVFSRDEPK
jgi:hypothetical protein